MSETHFKIDFTLIWVLLISSLTFTLQAQEICNNAIDDDNDGLVDLNDSLDCNCNGTKQSIPNESLIPNHSFEEYIKCPTGYSQLDRAVGWSQASKPTSDYFNTCGYTHHGTDNRVVEKPPPKPLPTGNGYAGFYNGCACNGNPIGQTYKEYLGNCLDGTMEKGISYTMNFWISSSQHNRPIDIALFGANDCENSLIFDKNFDGPGWTGCPTAPNTQPGWEQLGEVSTNSTNSEWKNYTFTFTPSKDITAIVIGPGCKLGQTGDEFYYYMDGLTLLKTEKFFPVNIFETGGGCAENILLHAKTNSEGSFQWYKDGVAIIGATDSLYETSKGEKGNFQVKINFSSGGCSVSPSHTVDPDHYILDAQFTADTACLGSSTSFTDKSTATNLTIDTWSWDFGDGSTSTAQNPTHKYSTPGTYQIKLMISTTDGCEDSITHQVKVLPMPQVTLTDTAVCERPYTLAAILSGIDPVDADIRWSTGETGSLSIDISQTGNYHVIVSADGCVDTAFSLINVDSSYTSFSDTTICENTLPLDLNISVNGQSSTWNTGETGNSISADTAGLYIATTQLDQAGNCIVVDSFTVSVDTLPIAPLTDSLVACNGNNQSLVLDAKNPGAEYSWSTGESVRTITVTNDGDYWVSITKGTCSTADTINVGFRSSEVIIDFDAEPVCLEDTSVFINNTTVTDDSVISWNWDFGNGSTSDLETPTYRYDSSGTFNVTLNVQTALGCMKSFTGPVRVLPLPVADFIPTFTCLGTETSFSGQASVSGEQVIESWEWMVKDSIFSGKEALYLFDQPGPNQMQLVITSNKGCRDTVVKEVMVNPKPVANFSPQTAGCAPVTVNFHDSSSVEHGDVIIWQWDFGDGSGSSEQHPAHTYESPGIYDVTLAVMTDDRCRDTLVKEKTVIVHPGVNANFSSNPEVTVISLPEFEFTDLSDTTAVNWEWDFGDDSGSTEQHPLHSYQDTGTYTVTLFVSNAYGCTDTTISTVRVMPEWSFYVPNTFTPNGNSLNEEFIGSGTGIKEHRMRIYDRWGKQIYDTGESTLSEIAPWNGRLNNNSRPCPQDTYVYVVQVTDVFNKKHKFVGHVSLIR